MATHVRILGWLQIVLGLLDLVLAVAVFGIFAGLGVLTGLSGEATASLVTGLVGTALGGIMALTGLPNLVAGAGLLAFKGWARILALILALFNVLKFPWGTALAAYTFWVLTDEETKALFR